eukprot:333215_1
MGKLLVSFRRRLVKNVQLSSNNRSSTARNKSSLPKTITLRGGDLGPVKSKTMAQIFTVLPSLDALLGTIAPISSCSAVGIENLEKGTVEHLFIRLGGAHAAGVALTNYLSNSGEMSVEHAIAYGLAVRFLLGLCALYLSPENFKEILRVLAAAQLLPVGIILASIYSLMTNELLSPLLFANFLTLALALESTLLYLHSYEVIPNLTPFSDLENKSDTTKG